MALPRPPLRFGLTLGIRLFLLLIAIIAPVLMTYYVQTFSAFEDLHRQEVDALFAGVKARVEIWLAEVKEEERNGIADELRRIVGQRNGVKGISIFIPSPSALRGLEVLATSSSNEPNVPSAPNVPSDLEESAALKKLAQRMTGLRDQQALTIISYPLIPPKRSVRPLLQMLFPPRAPELRAVLRVEVDPDLVGFGQELPRLRTRLTIGAAGMTVVLGIGVVIFFTYAVRRPIQELTGAMEQAAGGNLNALVDAKSGEFGWLSNSYNQMLRRIKAGMDENRRLLEQIQGFNAELKVRIEEATRELAAKNQQLLAVNEKLFEIQRQLTTQEKLATLGEVATIVAHELGTPLNAISGHLQLLLDGKVTDPVVLSRLKVVDGQVDRLATIVRDVLKAMRVPPPKPEAVRIAKVIEAVTDLIRPLAQKRSVSIALKLEAGLPELKADANQLQQVLLNLFTNAMDAMEGGGELSVSARTVMPADIPAPVKEPWTTVAKDGYLQVDVADNGRGMAPEAAQRAFEPFYTTKDGGDGSGRIGLGLGLSICRQIVKNHQGEIAISTEPGKGTRFSIYLVLQPAAIPR